MLLVFERININIIVSLLIINYFSFFKGVYILFEFWNVWGLKILLLNIIPYFLTVQKAF
ncbi:hypothetical protein Ga0061079_10751 [Apibacter mensalis]|uniref:Uncharacterized protein n=1 Tax=Apibacter mensalis TaxID=1586267 RepID=A0A0X3AMP9_9FLAO|nr:hypothetical protein Ga0061079_10751 [Apibacter mensalis]